FPPGTTRWRRGSFDAVDVAGAAGELAGGGDGGRGEVTVPATYSSLRGALATKQSRLSPRNDSGLPRCARNDGDCCGYSISLTRRAYSRRSGSSCVASAATR